MPSNPAPMPAILSISFVQRLRLIITLPLFMMVMHSGAQICSDPANVIYGLTNGGFIHAVNTITGAVGPAINPAYPGNGPDQSNGIAYNIVNGKFYYFKRIPSSSIIEFVSFDPATMMYTILSSPPTTNSVYSGCLTADGTGYYTWDTQGTLFYYQISTDTWTLITTSIVDESGKDVDSIIRLHGSGDGAIDGYGNLWILPSSNSMYGLFRLIGPLPTSPVPSVTVVEIVAMTPPPAKFVGISFNNTGQIFMCTSTDKLYRLEDDMTLTLLSTLTLNMGDLTSCNFPIAILAKSDFEFTASISGSDVKLWWTPSGQAGVYSYYVEHSTDNKTWNVIANGNDLRFSNGKISYVDRSPVKGRNYYRIRVTDPHNKTTYSAVRIIEPGNDIRFGVWPNPATSNLFIQNSGDDNGLAVLYNQSGIKIKSFRISSGVNNIDIGSLSTGNYFLAIQSGNVKPSTHKIIIK